MRFHRQLADQPIVALAFAAAAAPSRGLAERLAERRREGEGAGEREAQLALYVAAADCSLAVVDARSGEPLGRDAWLRPKATDSALALLPLDGAGEPLPPPAAPLPLAWACPPTGAPWHASLAGIWSDVPMECIDWRIAQVHKQSAIWSVMRINNLASTSLLVCWISCWLIRPMSWLMTSFADISVEALVDDDKAGAEAASAGEHEGLSGAQTPISTAGSPSSPAALQPVGADDGHLRAAGVPGIAVQPSPGPAAGGVAGDSLALTAPLH